MKNNFRFKQFNLDQDRCAMKVGTDGVLLGAWASLEKSPENILDIGAGTGLISLLLAQRSLTETIDAIELDDNAYEQCAENFESSPWGDRLFCYHASLDEFVDEWEDTYDLIVSNPPFYSEDVSSGDKSRDQARQSQSLPFDQLLEGVSRLLSPKGTFATIIPFRQEEAFLQIAAHCNLFPQRITRVKGNPTSGTKRSLMEFVFNATDVKIKALTIEIRRHEYTKDYIELTKDFYLKM